jgi:hypothetical protein
MIQLFIALFGLLALVMLMSTNPTHRRLGPFVGLLGQPLWLASTWGAQQYGMFALSIAYTLAYAIPCLAHLFAWSKRNG